MTLVDSNILVDVLANDPMWLDWSMEALDACSAQGALLVNEIVYAELAVKSSNKEELDSALADLRVVFERTPQEALFLAGKVYGSYRRAGGTRSTLLPDFFIGAHAQVARLPLLTRDTRRYRTYFPGVTLIAP
jgi:predicted nucleic acid-binding protein